MITGVCTWEGKSGFQLLVIWVMCHRFWQSLALELVVESLLHNIYWNMKVCNWKGANIYYNGSQILLPQSLCYMMAATKRSTWSTCLYFVEPVDSPVFTTAHYRTLSWSKWVSCTSFPNVVWRSIAALCFHLRLGRQVICLLRFSEQKVLKICSDKTNCPCDGWAPLHQGVFQK
jgi:hypothetical protein